MEQLFGARAPSSQDEVAAVRAPPAISSRTSASSDDGSLYSSGRLSFRDDAPRTQTMDRAGAATSARSSAPSPVHDEQRDWLSKAMNYQIDDE